MHSFASWLRALPCVLANVCAFLCVGDFSGCCNSLEKLHQIYQNDFYFESKDSVKMLFMQPAINFTGKKFAFVTMLVTNYTTDI